MLHLETTPKGKLKELGTIGNKSFIFIENVLLVNGLKHNLLSISQLCYKGFKVVFECMNCQIGRASCRERV